MKVEQADNIFKNNGLDSYGAENGLQVLHNDWLGDCLNSDNKQAGIFSYYLQFCSVADYCDDLEGLVALARRERWIT